jgi:hypothetical protein
MFTDDAGTDWVLNQSGGGGAWASETNSTTGASPANTIATPVTALTDGDQTVVEVLIFGEDNADPSNTYFRRQIFTYYRDGGTTTLWSISVDDAEQRLGTFSTSTTATLTTSGNDIIVNADTTGTAGTIDWTVLYLTRGNIEAASGGGSGSSSAAPSIIGIEGASSGAATNAETWFQTTGIGVTTTAPTSLTNTYHFNTSYDGRVLRATLLTQNDPGSTTVRVYKDFEVTASISATVTSSTLVGSHYITQFEFAASDTFARNEVLTVSMDTTNAPGEVSFNMTVALTGLGTVSSSQIAWDVTTQTSTFTALVNRRYKYDASTFSGQINMPASPANGDVVWLKNVSSSATGVTLSGNGNNVEDPTTYSLAATATLSGDGAAFTYSFDGTQWLLI